MCVLTQVYALETVASHPHLLEEWTSAVGATPPSSGGTNAIGTAGEVAQGNAGDAAADAIAVVIGLVGTLIYHRSIAFLGALAALTSALTGLYHSGVEQNWWEGPSSCTAQPLGDLTAAEALAKILAAPVVRCDEIPWGLFGMSMASWNAVVSLLLVLIWLQAARS